MTRFRQWNLMAYRGLLTLFPDELRNEFSAEMLEAFDEDLELERSLRGIRGVFRVWRVALSEVIRIGLPGWLKSPGVAVPLLSAATVLALQSPILIVAVSRYVRPDQPTVGETLVAFSIETVATLLAAFAVVYRRSSSRVISLHLG